MVLMAILPLRSEKKRDLLVYKIASDVTLVLNPVRSVYQMSSKKDLAYEKPYMFLVLGLLGGGVLGLARIAQGQHFLSDVIWSGGMVYLTGVILSYLFRLSADAKSRSKLETTQPVILSLDGPSDSETEMPDRDDVTRRRAA